MSRNRSLPRRRRALPPRCCLSMIFLGNAARRPIPSPACKAWC